MTKICRDTGTDARTVRQCHKTPGLAPTQFCDARTPGQMPLHPSYGTAKLSRHRGIAKLSRRESHRLTALPKCRTVPVSVPAYFCQPDRFHYDLQKRYFSACTVNIWNSLPNHVVDVNTVNLFKANLDRFCMNQDIKYDFTADLIETGERSEYKKYEKRSST